MNTGPSPLAVIRRNPRDVSVIYAADKFLVNTPEYDAQVTRMFTFSFVRKAGALKTHLHSISTSSNSVKEKFYILQHGRVDDKGSHNDGSCKNGTIGDRTSVHHPTS